MADLSLLTSQVRKADHDHHRGDMEWRDLLGTRLMLSLWIVQGLRALGLELEPRATCLELEPRAMCLELEPLGGVGVLEVSIRHPPRRPKPLAVYLY